MRSSTSLLLALLTSLLLFSLPEGAEAQNFVVARMYNGGSGQGATGGYQLTANQSIDVRTWPPNCGVQLPASGGPPGTVNQTGPPQVCPRGYIFNHPNNPILANTGMNGPNITFNAAGFDYASGGPLILLPGFWLQNMAQENYGVASVGPGLGLTGTGMVTWNATGFDPADLGTQMFTYDPPATATGSVVRTFPPNASLPAPVGYTGGMVYTPKPGGPRYGGTLGVTGESIVFLALTFNAGVYTTYSLPVPQTTVGTPIPTQTISNTPVPGASLVQRRKVFAPQNVRPVVSTPTPGVYPVLGATTNTRITYAVREEGPWTTGMVFVSNMSRVGIFPTTTYRTDTGTANVTAGGVGTIQLVKPYLIRSAAVAGRNGRSFNRKVKLDIFVPEPGSTLLLATGVAGLLLIEVARRRRH
jgi:hypothetical protein